LSKTLKSVADDIDAVHLLNYHIFPIAAFTVMTKSAHGHCKTSSTTRMRLLLCGFFSANDFLPSYDGSTGPIVCRLPIDLLELPPHPYPCLHDENPQSAERTPTLHSEIKALTPSLQRLLEVNSPWSKSVEAARLA
jgi:hypothetical protein